MRNKKVRVALIFGGKSGEHEVSLSSARGIQEALDPERYEVIPIGITREGQRLLSGEPMKQLTRAAQQSRASIGVDGRHEPDEVVATAELLPRQGSQDSVRLATADVVFPVLHGPYGEDGTIQGLLEIADLPYVGSGVAGSAVGMDKILMKGLFAAAHLPQLPYVALTRREWERQPGQLLELIESQLKYPLFVKPANLGSSVGISKVRTRDELAEGLSLAARYDRRLLVEQGLERPREVEVAVLGNDAPEASVAGEIIPQERHEFYNYESKYEAGEAELVIPARLEESKMLEVQAMAIRAFKAVDAAGLSRVDFLLDRESGELYLNELNTMPGFTPTSMYPLLWEASGLPYPKLLERLIDLALERHEDRQRNSTAF